MLCTDLLVVSRTVKSGASVDGALIFKGLLIYVYISFTAFIK